MVQPGAHALEPTPARRASYDPAVIDPAAVRRRTARVNGVELLVLEAGDPAAPPVILSHGFPEGAYSWRHQLPVLAAAGYHVIAPDQRGYGSSSAPQDVADYGIRHLTDDLLALVDETGHQQAVFVGHDWGALIVWDLARLHPERVKAVVGVSVPFVQWPAPPTQLMKMMFTDRFFYILYFQPVGPADSELGADPYRTMATVLWAASGEGFAGRDTSSTELPPMEGTGFLTNMPEPPPRPWSWLTEDDLQVYVDEFATSGFFGPLSYYRNLDANFEVVSAFPPERLSMPSFFIGGEHDPVLVMDPSGLERMAHQLPDYRGHVLLPGTGHWTQQESPDAFNDALLGFLSTV
jgi:pimeloyl-ACP methyl ester carboxylesterase